MMDMPGEMVDAIKQVGQKKWSDFFDLLAEAKALEIAGATCGKSLKDIQSRHLQILSIKELFLYNLQR